MSSSSKNSNIPVGRVAARVQVFQDIHELEHHPQLNYPPRILARDQESGITVGRGHREERAFASPAGRFSRFGNEDNQRHPEAKPMTVSHTVHPSIEEKEVVPTAISTTEDIRPASISTRQEQAKPDPSRPERAFDLSRNPSTKEKARDVTAELTAVRSRLRSIREVGKSQRDEISDKDDLMDEIGNMLDDAIARTMTPSPQLRGRESKFPRLSPSTLAVPFSSGQSSETLAASEDSLEPRSSADTSGHGYQELIGAGMPALSPTRRKERTASPYRMKPSHLDIPTKAMSPTPQVSIPTSKGCSSSDRHFTEPAIVNATRTGFPLPSPVRQRALLWESLAKHPEEGQICEAPYLGEVRLRTDAGEPLRATNRSTSPLMNRLREPLSSRTSSPVVPSVPPQLARSTVEPVEDNDDQEHGTLNLSMENAKKSEDISTSASARMSEDKSRATSENVSETSVKIPPEKRYSQPLPERRSSFAWPGRLRFPHRSISATTQQSVDVANADSEHDEHHPDTRPSIVKSKIRDLLTATKRKDKSEPSRHVSAVIEAGRVRGSIIRRSIEDVETLDENKVSALSLPVIEQGEIPAEDGAEPNPRTPCHQRNPSVSATIRGRVSTNIDSPIKVNHTTPDRGRSQHMRQTFMPSGRPYAIEQRFSLSPTRSISSKSKGGVRVSIEFRKSPHRAKADEDEHLIIVRADVDPEEGQEEQMKWLHDRICHGSVQA